MPIFDTSDILATGLTVYGKTVLTGTGLNIFSISGSAGQLLTINDTVSSTLFNVSNTGGTNLFTVGSATTQFYPTGGTASTLFISAATGVVIGGDTFDPVAPEALAISAFSPTSYNIISAHAKVNNYAQINMQNLGQGSLSSSDIVATNDLGTESSYYVDLGINSSTYAGGTGLVGQANDSYLYSTNNDFWLGTLGGSGSDLRFFTNTGGTVDMILSGGTGNFGIGIGTNPPTNRFTVSAATDPIKIVGVQSAFDNNILSIDSTGVFHVGSKTFFGNDGKLEITSISALTIPVSGVNISRVGIFNTQLAKRSFVTQIGNYGTVGLDTALMQPLLAKRNLAYWNAPGNSSTVASVFGFNALTVSGTATARNVGIGGIVSRIKRLAYASTAAANAIAFQYSPSAQVTCGTGTANTLSDGSGFFSVTRFVPSNTAIALGERFFVGFTSSVAQPTNVEPSTLTNTIGMAQLSSDQTQFYLVYGGSAAQTAIPMGTALGPPSGNTLNAYEFSIYSPQSLSATYFVQATNILSGTTFQTVLSGVSTIVPPSGTLLAWRIWKTPNTGATAVAYDLSTVYIETDT